MAKSTIAVLLALLACTAYACDKCPPTSHMVVTHNKDSFNELLNGLSAQVLAKIVVNTDLLSSFMGYSCMMSSADLATLDVTDLKKLLALSCISNSDAAKPLTFLELASTKTTTTQGGCNSCKVSWTKSNKAQTSLTASLVATIKSMSKTSTRSASRSDDFLGLSALLNLNVDLGKSLKNLLKSMNLDDSTSGLLASINVSIRGLTSLSKQSVLKISSNTQIVSGGSTTKVDSKTIANVNHGCLTTTSRKVTSGSSTKLVVKADVTLDSSKATAVDVTLSIKDKKAKVTGVVQQGGHTVAFKDNTTGHHAVFIIVNSKTSLHKACKEAGAFDSLVKADIKIKALL